MWKIIAAILGGIGLALAGYVYWQRSHPPPPPPIAHAFAPTLHLAPPGTFFLVRYQSVTSDSGITGFPPGTKVSLIRESGSAMHVTDGHIEFDVAADDVTNDLDIAARVSSGDARAQEQIGRLIASQSSFISILQATYGCPGRAIDITAVLQARVAGGERHIRAGNDLAGDPAPGCSKTLTVIYAVGGGVPVTDAVREGGSLTFPPQPAPAVVAETPARRRAPYINPLDRPAYDQKHDVARPPRIYYPPRP